jgi:hypothetical protein
VLLAGCGGDDAANDFTPTALIPMSGADSSATAGVVATSAGPALTRTPPMSLEIGAVVWTAAVDAQTKAPTGAVDSFPADAPTLYAALPVRNLPPNTILTAEWTYNSTSLDRLTTTAVSPYGIAAGWVDFHLTRSDEPWPDGSYAISISVDGQVIQTADIAVENG